MSLDVRWLQRFRNLQKAFAKLEEAVRLPTPSELEVEGMVQRFEYTYELAWNTLKDYLLHEGIEDVQTPRAAIREAFRIGLLTDGTGWLQMLESRNRTSHTYNERAAAAIAAAIRHTYYPYLRDLVARLTQEATRPQ